MITHGLPSKTRVPYLVPPERVGKLGLRDVQRYTELVPNHDDPSTSIVTHYEALRTSPLCRKDNSGKGTAFEQCIYDALLKFGVQPDNIILWLNLTSWVQPVYEDSKVRLEVDFVFPPTDYRAAAICMGAKASCRERWAQWLAIAVLAPHKYMGERMLRSGQPPVHVGVAYNEQPDKRTPSYTPAAQCDYYKKLSNEYLKVRCVHDHRSILELFTYIRDGKRPDWI